MITITIMRLHLDYGDVIFDHNLMSSYNNFFHQRLEYIQYNAALAITGAIRGTSKEKLYQELGFKSLQFGRFFRKLFLFYNIMKNESPSYLYHLIPNPETLYSIHNSENLSRIKDNHSFFKNTFFPFTIIELDKLDWNIRCSPSSYQNWFSWHR